MKKVSKGNKNKNIKNFVPYNIKCRRTIYLNKLIQKNSIALIYGLMIFAFACLVLLLTFVFHVYIR